MGISRNELIIIILPLFLLTISIMKYMFPHFSMHLFMEGPIAGMNLQSDYFTGKCKHKDIEIDGYRMKQKPMIMISSIILLVVVAVLLFS